MKQKIYNIILDAIKTIYPDIEGINFMVSATEPKYGDYTSNVAMIIGRLVDEKPAEVATKIIAQLKDDMIESCEIAGPGFINFKISVTYFQKEISEIINAKESYGSSNFGKNLKVDVEFISGNPTGPLTIGNSRGGVIGDVLSSILTKSGYQVTREYYFNDKGGQIDILGHSILKDSEAQYRGEYIDDLAEEVSGKDAREVGEKAAQILIQKIKKTTENMGIKFDVWFAEGKDLRDKGKVDEIIKWLKTKDLVYEKEGAVWFKSTTFGDDKDRVLLKTGGEPTYFASDCAYHENKFADRKFDKCINIWGADHHGDVARVRGFVTALGYDDKFEIIIHQFVRIVVDGKEVRMSKRAGNFVLVDDLLSEVGTDVYRFFMLAYDPNSHLTFDLKLAKEKSDKNPVYYIQYAYARINSILAKIDLPDLSSQTRGARDPGSITLIKEPEEIELIKKLIKLPELVEEIAGDYQVQKLAFYARDLANSFHHFYEKCPVVKASSPELTQARAELLEATKIVLKNTLDLIGVSSPEKM